MKINVMFILPKWQNGHFKQRYSLLGDSTTANVYFCLYVCCVFTENYIPFKERTSLFSHLYWLSFKIPVWVGRSLESLQNLSVNRVIMQAKGSFQLFIEHRKITAALLLCLRTLLLKKEGEITNHPEWKLLHCSPSDSHNPWGVSSELLEGAVLRQSSASVSQHDFEFFSIQNY